MSPAAMRGGRCRPARFPLSREWKFFNFAPMSFLFPPSIPPFFHSRSPFPFPPPFPFPRKRESLPANAGNSAKRKCDVACGDACRTMPPREDSRFRGNGSSFNFAPMSFLFPPSIPPFFHSRSLFPFPPPFPFPRKRESLPANAGNSAKRKCDVACGDACRDDAAPRDSRFRGNGSFLISRLCLFYSRLPFPPSSIPAPPFHSRPLSIPAKAGISSRESGKFREAEVRCRLRRCVADDAAPRDSRFRGNGRGGREWKRGREWEKRGGNGSMGREYGRMRREWK